MQDNMSRVATVVKALGLDEACVKLLEGTPILTQKLQHVEQIYASITSIGSTLNVSPQAEELIEALTERINIVVHKLKFIPDNQRPSVQVVTESVQEDGSAAYMDMIIKTAGGRAYRGEVAEGGPDVLVFPARNKSMFQLLGEIPALLADAEWERVPAIQQNKIYLIDGEKHLLENLSDVANDVELMAEVLYPQYFIYGGEGESWMKFELS
ncbi:hypothetical protein RYH73_19770 [Olivibacter sp. CPCC 100613]|uniref:ABC transporter substrate-binding protein n=1 Tax=Olivibacter sp. CPCC 100613 TaxID=3079931 RepID=UPI002FF6769E